MPGKENIKNTHKRKLLNKERECTSLDAVFVGHDRGVTLDWV